MSDPWTHEPGARYWIPTHDEWLKAVYFDPNRYGSGQSGWWMYPHSSDIPPIPGPPGIGQTSAGWIAPIFGDEYHIPVGSYPNSLSPWGLFDASGGVTELIEDYHLGINWNYRIINGDEAGYIGFKPMDLVYLNGSLSPISSFAGLRLAAPVPAPSAVTIFMLVFAWRRRR